jgi:hypothetical protein
MAAYGNLHELTCMQVQGTDSGSWRSKAAMMGLKARKNSQSNILVPCSKSLSLLEFAALFSSAFTALRLYPRVA